MTVIVTSKVIAKRVKNIVASRLEKNDASSSKRSRHNSDPNLEHRKMNGKRARKKRKRYHEHPPETSSLSSLSSTLSSSTSSLSPSSQASKSSQNNLQGKPFRRKHPPKIESSEYDDSDDAHSDEQSVLQDYILGKSFSTSICGKILYNNFEPYYKL